MVLMSIDPEHSGCTLGEDRTCIMTNTLVSQHLVSGGSVRLIICLLKRRMKRMRVFSYIKMDASYVER